MVIEIEAQNNLGDAWNVMHQGCSRRFQIGQSSLVAW